MITGQLFVRCLQDQFFCTQLKASKRDRDREKKIERQSIDVQA